VTANEFVGAVLPCSSAGAEDNGAIATWIADSLPNTSNLQRRQLELYFSRYSRQGNCVFDPSTTLEHYEVNRPYWVNTGILFGYLFALHLLTYGAMLVSSRRERR
jgi:hypothetical protein